MYKITMYWPCLLTKFHNFSVYLISGTQVPNWSISMDDKVKLTKCQNHHHHGVYLTCGPTRQDLRPSGQRGQLAGPTPRPVGQGLRWFILSLGCHASTRGGEAWVGGGCSTQSADQLAWPAGHHLASNRPPQVGGGPIHHYKYPLAVKVKIPHSTCSSPLVKVPV
jgi:hypothetical protein